MNIIVEIPYNLSNKQMRSICIEYLKNITEGYSIRGQDLYYSDENQMGYISDKCITSIADPDVSRIVAALQLLEILR